MAGGGVAGARPATAPRFKVFAGCATSGVPLQYWQRGARLGAFRAAKNRRPFRTGSGEAVRERSTGRDD